MTGQEDEFPWRKASNQDIDNHSEEHNHRHFFTETLLCHGHNGFIIRYHALNTECMLEYVGEITQR
ncbi:Uncharacterised protein [Yersinia enterocolitica]|nr:Uncharacterised protein [Yersinia enterocolitica]